MPLRLYLDDCANDRRLAEILRGEPYQHDVASPLDVGLAGVDDDVHFAFARREERVVLTKNPRDFAHLHQRHPHHPGVFAIYQDNDPRDMTPVEIARAIRNLVDAGVPIAGGFHVLNAWR